MIKKDIKQNASLLYPDLLKQVMMVISDRFGIHFNNNDIITITTYLYDYTRFTFELRNYSMNRKDEIEDLKQFIKFKTSSRVHDFLDIVEACMQI